MRQCVIGTETIAAAGELPDTDELQDALLELQDNQEDALLETSSRTEDDDDDDDDGEPLGSGPVEGPSIVHLPPRTPVPKMISFDCFETIPTTTTGSSNEDEDTEDDNIQNDECNSLMLDPVDLLVHGAIENKTLAASAEKLHQLLQQHLLHGTEVHESAVAVIRAAPETCQVRYHPPGFQGAVLPLSYFCATGHLLNIQTAYHAFPEAIGQEDPWVGTPLHYACYHNAGFDVVEFLMQKFPEAVRVTNYAHRTCLHMACMSDTICRATLMALLDRYPTAAQLADQDGYTPFHLACWHGASMELLLLLIQTSPSVVRMSTRSLQKPLHVASLHAPVIATVLLLLQRDPTSARATDEYFNTALHCAATGMLASVEVLQVLVQAHPGAVFLTNDFDETPYDIAKRQGAVEEVLQLLKP
jgi:hypothetical protein